MSIFQLNTAMDLQMICALDARERTRMDWEARLKSADQRLTIVDMMAPKGSADGVIEIILNGRVG